MRLLPDFLVIGTLRGGTSSLYKYLGHHPGVVPSLRKETWYFAARYDRGPGWYRSHFPLRIRRTLAKRIRGRELLTFEASPNYLFDPDAPARAGALVPSARLIALLRNPVDRAVSNYLQNVERGFEDLSLEDALNREEELIEKLERMGKDPVVELVRSSQPAYFARGVYVEHLRRWLEHYPRDRLLIVRSEDLYERPAEAYGQILAFLGLPPWGLGSFPNYSRTQTEASAVAEETRERLAERYSPHNTRLYELLGRDFGWDAAQVSAEARAF